jgi:alanyl-tRNA synthetase
VAVDAVYGELAAEVPSAFRGYETLELTSPIRALLRGGVRVERAAAGDEVEIVVEQTPFYPEGGGQVGDQGRIEMPGGSVLVQDTRKPAPDCIVHRGKVLEGEIRLGEEAHLVVDAEARAATVRNHSGTHLLHAALRRVLGPQAMQKGSLVAPNRLRFDFTHDAPLTREEIERIEDLVNQWIEANAPANVRFLPYAEAIESGAIAIFEEKYGDRVRVISFGEVSTELCGGTHARATGDIGLLKIVSETGIAAGVRRIEALTGLGALEHVRQQERVLRRAAELLRAAAQDVPERLEKLLEERRALERELEKARSAQRSASSRDLLEDAREIDGTRVLATRVDGVGGKELRTLVDELRGRLKSGVVLLASEQEGRVTLALGVTPDLREKHSAGDLIREVAEIVGGKGGGRPDFAQAGGTQPEKLDAAFERLYELLGQG